MRAIFCSLLLISALCACGGATTTQMQGLTPDRIATSVARRVTPVHVDRGRSWMSPELQHAEIPVLFVSDSGTADVYIYKLPSLKLVGTVTGFSQPQGECSDNKGNVWVTDASAQTIYELSHRGHLENELSDPTGYPVGCAWDPLTGSLAVMNIFDTGSAGGVVLVYSHGSQQGQPYENSSQYFYNFGGYDNNGNLFFDGRDADGSFMLSELPKGASSAHTVKLSGGTIYFPGMVEWDSTKQYLIVGDQSCGNVYTSCVYTVKIGGKSGAITRRVDLSGFDGGSVCDLVQGVQYNNQLAGSDDDFCNSTANSTDMWSWPRGGVPSRYNDTSDVTPVGAAISR